MLSLKLQKHEIFRSMVWSQDDNKFSTLQPFYFKVFQTEIGKHLGNYFTSSDKTIDRKISCYGTATLRITWDNGNTYLATVLLLWNLLSIL